MKTRQDLLREIEGCNKFNLTEEEVRNYFLLIKEYIESNVVTPYKPGEFVDWTLSERQRVCLSLALRKLYSNDIVQALHETYDIIHNYNTKLVYLTYNEHAAIEAILELYSLVDGNIEVIQVKHKADGYTDYDICENNTKIGVLQTIEDKDRDYIFIRQLRIFDEHQRQGIGSRIIDQLVVSSHKKIKFSVATNSNKAVGFWNKYLDKTKFNKKNTHGYTWEIWK